MKIQFDPKQEYQLDAVNAVVELFDGQPLEKPDYSVIFQTMDTELFAGTSAERVGRRQQAPRRRGEAAGESPPCAGAE